VSKLFDLSDKLLKSLDGVIGLANAGEIETIKESFKNSYKIVTAMDGFMT